MKNIVFCLCFILCGFVFAREVELAIVKETRDPEFSEAKFLASIRYIPKEAYFINADELAHPENLAKIKRIVIPAFPRIFTVKMLDGMERYVGEGGLIITDSIMNGIDTNGDFKEDFSLFLAPGKRKAGHPRPQAWPPTGVCAHASIKVESVTALMECPLSNGFTVGELTPVSFHFRNVIRADGTVIFSAVATGQGGRRKNSMPLAVMRHSGKGAFLFLPLRMEKLVKNALSAQTLDWLTDQE